MTSKTMKLTIEKSEAEGQSVDISLSQSEVWENLSVGSTIGMVCELTTKVDSAYCKPKNLSSCHSGCMFFMSYMKAISIKSD